MSSEISKNSEKLTKSDSLDRNIVEEIIDGFTNIDLCEKELKYILSDIKSLDICKDEDVYKSLVYDLMFKSNVTLMNIKYATNEINIYKKPRYSFILDILEYKNKKAYDNIAKKLNINTEYKTGIDLTDDFTLESIRYKNYFVNGVFNFEELFADISRSIVRIENKKNVYYKKEVDIGVYDLILTNIDDVKEISKNIILINDDKEKEIVLHDVLFNYSYNEIKSKYINAYTKKLATFYSNDPKYLSLFNGFGYPIKDDINVDKIEPFLSFIKDIIADNDNNVYDYILKWISYIIQNPGKRTNVCLILTGGHGTGKTTFINTICELFGRYSKTNSQRLDDIIGSFNGIIENKMIVVINELSVVGHINKKSIYNKLKSLISDDKIIINRKGIDQYSVDNVSNFIICSNDFNPIMIENDDIYYADIEVSNKVANDKDYFGELKGIMDKDFYINLFNYFRTYDCDGFKELDIPHKKIKKFVIGNNQDSFHHYMRENINDYYPKGRFSSKAYAFSAYIEFCQRERLKITYNSMQFKSLLETICCLKSRYIKEIKDSRKYYTLMEDYVKDYINNDQ